MGRIIKETAQFSDMGAATSSLSTVEDNLSWRVPSMVSVKQIVVITSVFQGLVLSRASFGKGPVVSFDVVAEAVKKTASNHPYRPVGRSTASEGPRQVRDC